TTGAAWIMSAPPDHERGCRQSLEHHAAAHQARLTQALLLRFDAGSACYRRLTLGHARCFDAAPVQARGPTQTELKDGPCHRRPVTTDMLLELEQSKIAIL